LTASDQALRLEDLWALQDRLAEQRRRRENCALRIAYHERLGGVFRDQSERHERERDRYQRVLQDLYTIEGGEGNETEDGGPK
jgi:hypothetical protein